MGSVESYIYIYFNWMYRYMLIDTLHSNIYILYIYIHTIYSIKCAYLYKASIYLYTRDTLHIFIYEIH